MNLNIILSGVGGQGILSIAAIIGQACLKEGLYLKQAEVHGMSQRGGDVQSNLRISDKPISSDLIAKGGADIIISLEPMEALRYTQYLKEDGYVVTNSEPFINIPTYPEVESIISEIKALPNSVLVNTKEIAQEVKSPRGENMVLLGAASHFLGIEFSKLEDGIRDIFGGKGEAIVEANINALNGGRKAAETK